MPYENLRSQAISFLSACAIVFVVLNEMKKETRCGLLHNRFISLICKRTESFQIEIIRQSDI